MRADTRNKYSQHNQILESSENRLDSLQHGGQIIITQIPEDKIRKFKFHAELLQ